MNDPDPIQPTPPAPASTNGPADPFDFPDNGSTDRDERAALHGGRSPALAPVVHAEPPRRGFFRKLLAVAVGGIVTAVPAAAGLMVFFDPVRRGRKAAGAAGGGAAAGDFLPVAPLEALPADGRPMKFQVIADRVDAWTKYRNVPMGAVYLKRTGETGAGGTPRVVAWNVVCPHAGCFVDVVGDGKQFRCPCHNSGFKEDGSLAPGSVSPRPMDELEVDAEALKQGTVRVKFQNFVAGTHEKIPVT